MVESTCGQIKDRDYMKYIFDSLESQTRDVPESLSSDHKKTLQHEYFYSVVLKMYYFSWNADVDGSSELCFVGMKLFVAVGFVFCFVLFWFGFVWAEASCPVCA